MAGKSHPGFKAAQAKIAKSGGYGMKAAGAILAKKTREASPAARAENPRLNKVRGASRKSSRRGGR